MGRIVVEGVKSIPQADIRAVVAGFENRALGEGDLREVERRLTRLYVEKGFATSGVVRKEIGPRAIAAGAAPGATIVTFTARSRGACPRGAGRDRARLTLAVFFDAAYARDSVVRDDGAPRSITSVGVGALAALPWGFALRLDVARPNRRWLTPNADWQDRGVHFQVSWSSGGV